MAFKRLENAKNEVNDKMTKTLTLEDEILNKRKQELEDNIKFEIKRQSEIKMEEKGEPLNDEEKRKISEEAFEQMYMTFIDDDKENTRIKVKSSALIMKESLENIAKSQISKDQEALLKKLLTFEDCMWKYDSESMQSKIYELFFDWKEAIKPRPKNDIDE